MVLYDKLGPGPHPCAECGRVLDWPELDVDHLNRDPADNRPENLQPVCSSCNTRLMWYRRHHRRPWHEVIGYPAWMHDPDCPEDWEGWPWEHAA